MRKIGFLVLCFCIIMSCVGVYAEESNVEIKSSSAILVHEATGRVMYEKNADAKAYPASTTKIMTALLAVENLAPNMVLSASETAIDIDRDGSNMGILYGEELTVEQLLYGLMVHSANDAANVLAEAVAETIPAFVEKMNNRAAELGMTGTHFVNTHGYHDENHYTTARDLMILAREAMKNDLFRQVVGTGTYEIPPTNKYQQTRIFANSNSLVNSLRDHRYVYEGAAGIKTGHTSDAGSCLVSYANRNGVAYYCVTLNAPVEYEGNYSFLDTIQLFDYGFKGHSLKTFSDVNEIVAVGEAKWGKGNGQVILSAREPLEILLPNRYDAEKLTKEVFIEEKIVAPVKQGDVLGRLAYAYDGTLVGSVDLVAKESVSRSFLKMIFLSLWGFIFNGWVMSALVVIVAVLILRSVLQAKKRQRARERRRQEFRRDLYR